MAATAYPAYFTGLIRQPNVRVDDVVALRLSGGHAFGPVNFSPAKSVLLGNSLVTRQVFVERFRALRAGSLSIKATDERGNVYRLSLTIACR